MRKHYAVISRFIREGKIIVTFTTKLGMFLPVKIEYVFNWGARVKFKVQVQARSDDFFRYFVHAPIQQFIKIL